MIRPIVKPKPRPCALPFGPEKIPRETTYTFTQQPVLPIRYSEFIVPRWPAFFSVVDIRIGRESCFLTPNEIPAYFFRPGSESARIVQNRSSMVGQLVTVVVRRIVEVTSLVSCRVRDDVLEGELPESWKEIENRTLARLHPRNPRHQYEVSLAYDFSWPMPEWVDARFDVPHEGEWLAEWGPDPLLLENKAFVDSLQFCGVITGESLDD